VWRIFEEDLYLVHHKYDFKILSFVLMPNHFHMVARVTDVPIGKIMSELLTSVSKEINRYSGRINQNFGGRHYKCILDSTHYLFNCHKYVYQNPVRAGLSNRAELWRFSTLNGILGLSKLFIPLELDSILFNPDFDERELAWINRPIRPEHLEDFRKALSKRIFNLPKKNIYLPRHSLDSERI
jgi:putative transposase